MMAAVLRKTWGRSLSCLLLLAGVLGTRNGQLLTCILLFFSTVVISDVIDVQGEVVSDDSLSSLHSYVVTGAQQLVFY